MNQDLLNRLVSLVDQNLVKVADIKNTDYLNGVISYYKAKVVAGTITTDEYKTITGQDYTA